mmetsp:Transcript_20589/g.45690  ORF Transcript_20589/g.45690 Transcript_20589/m.45690 type:complete len:181 (-) Transcript_20589:349-891(-)
MRWDRGGMWSRFARFSKPTPTFFDRIYVAVGSGGTAAGLALGLHLSGALARRTKLIGMCVDDSPEVFIKKIDGIFGELGVSDVSSGDIMTWEQRTNLGYGVSHETERQFILQTARETGVILDPVYTSKAALGMVEDLAKAPDEEMNVLFVHTGGLLGAAAKGELFAQHCGDLWQAWPPAQ